MTILGIDCSATAASCAIARKDGDSCELLGQAAVNVKITHSQTLLPLTESLLRATGLTLRDVDGFAVTNGPGSFTGLRIGASLAKGLAYPLGKPVCGVSSLLAMAYSLQGRTAVIACPVMDARRGEVYNALFAVDGNAITRLTPDRAIKLDELREQTAREYPHNEVVFVGQSERVSAAVGACFAAAVCGEFRPAGELRPQYLRKPQAERERLRDSADRGSAPAPRRDSAPAPRRDSAPDPA